MSFEAASSRVPAVMLGPSAATVSARLSGPRLFAMVAGIPRRASAVAMAALICPAPMMPMLGLVCSCIAGLAVAGFRR
jgi:hypothetical protein